MNGLLKYRFVALFTLTVFLSACSSPPNNRFEIQGTVINNPNDSTKLYYMMYQWVEKQGYRDREGYADSVTVINNRFTISGIIDEPKHIYISDTLYNWSMPRTPVNTNTVYFIEPTTMQAEIDLSIWENSKLTGSKSHTEFILLENRLKAIIHAPTKKLWEMDRASLERRRKVDSLWIEGAKANVQFIKQYPQSYVSLNAMTEYEHYTSAEQAVVDSIFRQMPAEMKSTPTGKYLSSRTGAHTISEGHYMPHFVMKDINDNEVSLKEIWTKSRYTLIHFCVSSFADGFLNLHNVYDNYHSKGLEIISVSLLRYEPENHWKEHIGEDSSAIWTKVREIKEGKTGKTRSDFLGVGGYPSKILVDQNGKVVATWIVGKPNNTKETPEEVLERLLR